MLYISLCNAIIIMQRGISRVNWWEYAAFIVRYFRVLFTQLEKFNILCAVIERMFANLFYIISQNLSFAK